MPEANTSETVHGYINEGNRRFELRYHCGAPYEAACWHVDPIGTTKVIERTPLTPESARRMIASMEFCTLPEPLIVPSERILIRVFMEGGLIQAVTGLPPGSVLRKIDLDVEGSLACDTHEIHGDDVPPYCDRDTREATGRSIRAFMGEFLPDGEQRPVAKGGN